MWASQTMTGAAAALPGESRSVWIVVPAPWEAPRVYGMRMPASLSHMYGLDSECLSALHGMC